MPRGLKVLFEDNHLLVADKPTLLPTMGVKQGVDSLVDQAKAYLREKYQKPGNVYLGVVSRLDSHVSGVIVLARTSKAARRLTEQFRLRQVEKTYLAIVPESETLPAAGRLQHRLVKNESQHRMLALSENAPHQALEKMASMVYETVGRHKKQRLLRVTLETGRKHQIRVQLAASDCPIVGDRKYGSELPFEKGIALHSYRLTLYHPTRKEPQSFQSEPPAFWRIRRFG